MRRARKWIGRYRAVGEPGRVERGADKRFSGRTHHTASRLDAAGVRRYMTGWEFVRIAIDDCTRLACAKVFPDERPSTAIAFPRRALAFFDRHGITVDRANRPGSDLQLARRGLSVPARLDVLDRLPESLEGALAGRRVEPIRRAADAHDRCEFVAGSPDAD